MIVLSNIDPKERGLHEADENSTPLEQETGFSESMEDMGEEDTEEDLDETGDED